MGTHRHYHPKVIDSNQIDVNRVSHSSFKAIISIDRFFPTSNSAMVIFIFSFESYLLSMIMSIDTV